MALRISISITGGPGGVAPTARQLAQYGEHAETHGFHAIYLTDHYVHRVPTLHAGSAVAVLAAATSLLRLGFSAYVLPLRHPLAAAKELAMLDGLSEGRLIAAFAVGSQEPEFTALGIPFAERGRRLDEGIAAVKALWTEDEASFEGHYYQFERIKLAPKPVQEPHPPIWIGSWTGATAAARRVAREAAGWQGSGLFTTLDEAKQAVAHLDAACRAIGRDPATLAKAYVNVITSIAPTAAQAWDHLGPAAQSNPARYVAGTPDDVIARLREMSEAGMGEVALILPTWDQEQLDLLGHEVLPAFR